jgi:hypothetical protein
VVGEARSGDCRPQSQRLQEVSTKRVCGECGKPFEQTFGGRPRKKCYECVPPRLNQAQQKAQRNGRQQSSTAGKHVGKGAASASVEPSGESGHSSPTASGSVQVASQPVPMPGDQHCPWCGAYTPKGQPFCNPQHRALFAEKVAAAKAKRPDVRPPLRAGPRGKRPLQRVRELHENQIASHHSDVRQRARERAKAA